MNLTALRTAVRTRLGVPTNDALFTDTVVTSLINAALHAIETKHDWEWLEADETLATVASQTYVAPTDTDWLRTISCTISGRVPLERRTITELDLMLGDSGTPRYWGVFNRKIELRPVPSAILSIKHRFVQAEPDLVSDSDTPLMPASFHTSIVELAAHYGFRRSKNLPAAGAALSDYQAWEERMLGRADRSSDSAGGGDAPTPPAPPADAAGRR